jgi:hypothetical protein
MTQTIPSPSRRWKQLLPLAAVLVLAALWSVYWWVAQGYAREAFAAERRALALNSNTLTCGSETWGGFPFRFEWSCEKPVLQRADGSHVSSHRISAVALAYKPWHVITLVDGPTSLKIGEEHFEEIGHSRAAMSIQFSDRGKASVSLEVNNITIDEDLMIGHLLAHTRPGGANGWDIAGSARDIRWRSDTEKVLVVESADLRGIVDAEMRIQVSNVSLQTGQVRYWGDGTIGLDRQRRLEGKLATETNDLDGLMAIIDPHLMMTSEQKANLRLVLGLLGKTAKADMIATGGELYIGPFKVGDLLPIY